MFPSLLSSPASVSGGEMTVNGSTASVLGCLLPSAVGVDLTFGTSSYVAASLLSGSLEASCWPPFWEAGSLAASVNVPPSSC